MAREHRHACRRHRARPEQRPNANCDVGRRRVKGAGNQMQKVMLNLCNDSRDAMPEGRALTITVENAVLDQTSMSLNPDARLVPLVSERVTDTGTRISPGIRESIFDP